MQWLPLALLLSFGFGQLFKWAQRRGCQAPVVVSTNYLVVAGSVLIYYLGRGGLHLTAPVLKVGMATGCAFIVSMLVVTRALEITDVGAALTAFRLAILIPIGTAVWLWNETMTSTQALGIGLAVVALVLMTRGKGRHSRLSGAGSLGLVLLIFLLQGVSHSMVGWVHHAGLDPQMMPVLMVTAATAGVLGGAFLAITRCRPRGRDLWMGGGIGLYNLGALSLMYVTLSQVPGTVFFALQGCAVVIMDNLFAHFYWRETLSLPAKIGAGLGALSVLLVL